jgi:hypothetical protein
MFAKGLWQQQIDISVRALGGRPFRSGFSRAENDDIGLENTWFWDHKAE